MLCSIVVAHVRASDPQSDACACACADLFTADVAALPALAAAFERAGAGYQAERTRRLASRPDAG